MCVSNNAIELQAFHYCEKIQESSVYKMARVEFTGGTFVECDEDTPLKAEFQGSEELPLIKNLILQSAAGKQYSVEPDELGFQFAKGELSYRQYLLAKKKQSRNMLWYTSGFTVLFTTAAWAFIHYFI